MRILEYNNREFLRIFNSDLGRTAGGREGGREGGRGKRGREGKKVSQREKEVRIVDSQSDADVTFPRKWRSGIILKGKRGRQMSS